MGAENERLQATTEGEVHGVRLATGVNKFLSELQQSVPDADKRMALLRFFNEQETSTKQLESTAKHLGSGSANLFLTPSDLNLKVQMPPKTHESNTVITT